MEKAFSYLRVSGAGQVEGDGFIRQTEAIERYAASAGLVVVQTFREEGVSGTKELDDRPALGELLAALDQSDDIRTVIIEKLDRLARDLMVQETIISDMQKRGYKIISASEPDLCSTDPSRVLIRQIFGAIAQYDKAMIVLRLRSARQRVKAKHGRCEGAKAFGSSEHHHLAICRMVSLRTSGMAVDKIALVLNSEGHLSKTGGKWYGSSVRNVLMREGAMEATA